MLAKEGCNMDKENNWQEEKRWLTDEIRASIDLKKMKKIGNIER